jgi:hypothetical protein
MRKVGAERAGTEEAASNSCVCVCVSTAEHDVVGTLRGIAADGPAALLHGESFIPEDIARLDAATTKEQPEELDTRRRHAAPDERSVQRNNPTENRETIEIGGAEQVVRLLTSDEHPRVATT